MFITWNGSIQEFRTLFNITTNRQHMSTNFSIISIDKKINFLDAEIGHINGHLRTGVKHNLRLEPCAFPYSSTLLLSQQKISTTSLIQEALLRATGCYSNVTDFENERNFLHWSLHHNMKDFYNKTETISSIMNRFFSQHQKRGEHFERTAFRDLQHRVREYDRPVIQHGFPE